MTGTCGARRASADSTSRSAAACSEVITPIARGSGASSRLRAGSNSPSNASCSEPQKGFTGCPARPAAWRRPATGSRRAVRTATRAPGSRPGRRPEDEPHRAGAAAEHDRPHGGAAVLIVKYQCPEAACVKLEISPRTHIAGMLRSNNCPTAWFSWATVRISRANTLFVTENSIVIRLFRCIPVHRAYGAGRNHTLFRALCAHRPQSQHFHSKSLIYIRFT